jgi:hypothetical protein
LKPIFNKIDHETFQRELFPCRSVAGGRLWRLFRPIAALPACLVEAFGQGLSFGAFVLSNMAR